MRAKGITYDTGFIRTGRISRERFDPEVVRRELAIIRDDLHCNAVQVVGGDPSGWSWLPATPPDSGWRCGSRPSPGTDPRRDPVAVHRLRPAGRAAAAGGSRGRVRRRRRADHHEPGIRAGGHPRRSGSAAAGRAWPPRRLAEVSARFDDFLGRAVAEIRECFAGRITYAAIPFERIDWTPFDFVSVELIRSAEVADQYRDGVRNLVAGGKPVAITGFGAATYRGARRRGAAQWRSSSTTRTPSTRSGWTGSTSGTRPAKPRTSRAAGDLRHRRRRQHLRFLFALGNLPHRPDGDPRDDLDLASPAIVKTLEGRHGDTYPDMTWEPKAAFTASPSATAADCRPRPPAMHGEHHHGVNREARPPARLPDGRALRGRRSTIPASPLRPATRIKKGADLRLLVRGTVARLDPWTSSQAEPGCMIIHDRSP